MTEVKGAERARQQLFLRRLGPYMLPSYCPKRILQTGGSDVDGDLCSSVRTEHLQQITHPATGSHESEE